MTDATFARTEKMLTPATLAAMLEISERHLSGVRQSDPTFPKPVLLGTLPRWSPAVIRRWMEGAALASCSCGHQLADVATAPAWKGAKARKGGQRVH